VAQASAILAPTLTRLSLAGNTLTAQVLTAAGTPWRGVQGTITYLDGGALLGRVPVGADGTASLALASSVSSAFGAHTLYAGFGGGVGSGAGAPSISPALVEQHSSAGALSLVPAGNSLTLPAGGPASMAFQASGPAGAVIAFSCGNAEEAGVACAFSPAALTGGGATALSVERLRSGSSGGQPFEKASSTPGSKSGPAPGGPLGAIAAALVAVCLVRPGRRQGAALLLCCAGLLGTASGCGSRARMPQASATVLVVQASTGVGPNALTHAVQVVVIVR
jgi:hypothetical protein